MSKSWGDFKKKYGLSSTKTLATKNRIKPLDDPKRLYGSSSEKVSGNNGQLNSWQEFKMNHGIGRSGKSWISQAQRNILAGKDHTYNNWIEDFDSFSQQMTNDYSERVNTYQNPDEFNLYANESISAAEELLSNTKAAKSFYTNNRDAAEKAYGEGSVDEVLMSLEEGEKYLQGIIEGINDESDYWKKWESVEDWGNSAKKHASDSMIIFSQSGSNAIVGMGSLYDQIENADLTTAEGQAFYKSLMDTIEPDVNAFILDNAELNAKIMIQEYSEAGGGDTAGMGSLYDQIEKTDFDTAEGQAFYSSLRATVEPALADKTSVFTYVKPYATQEEITANYIEGIETYYTDKREELDTLIRNAEQDPEYEELAMEYRSKFGGFDDIVVGNPEYERVQGYSPDLLHINVAAYYRQKGEVDKAIAVYEYNKTMKELDEQEKQKINAASQEVSAVLKSIEEQEGQEEFYSYIDNVQELDPLKIRKSEDYLRNVEAGKTAEVPEDKYFSMVTNLQGIAAGNKNTFLSELTDEQINDALYFVGQEDYESAQYIIDGRKIEDILSINAAISNQTTGMEEEYASERGELDTYIDEALDDPDFQKIVDEYREKYGDLTLINQANYGAYEGWSPNDMHCKVADYYRGKGDHKKANAVFHYNETIPEIDKHWQKEIKNTSYLIEEEMIKRELEEIDDPEFEETANQYKVFDKYSLDSYNELEAEGEFEVGSLTMMGLAQDPYVSSDEIQDMSLMTKEQRQYYAYYMMADKAKSKRVFEYYPP